MVTKLLIAIVEVVEVKDEDDEDIGGQIKLKL